MQILGTLVQPGGFLELVQLTPYQARLLTQLCSWIVLDQREVFEGLFG